MAKTKISEFSSTPGNNTDIDGINIAEGCAPSGINNAIRELMSQLKDFQAGTAGDSFNGPVGTTTAAAGAFTTLTTSGAVTHNAGTANGVAYLNGSKVLTTGSALTFDGTGLSVTGSTSATLKLNGRSSDNASSANFYNNTGATRYGFIYFDASTAQIASTNTTPLAFLIDNSEQMRLTSTGLGIGTSSPVYKLVVSNGGASGIEFGPAFSGTANLIQSYNRSGGAYVNTVYDANEHIFNTLGTQRLRLDTSGNLGLGVTPSAWSGYKAIQLSGGSIDSPGLNVFDATGNAYNNSGWKYVSNFAATLLRQEDGAFKFFNAPSGTAGNAISFTQAMSLTAAGELLVGATSNASGTPKLYVRSNDSSMAARFYSTGISDGQHLVYFDKPSATTSSNQVFVGFTINGQATGSGQINANGASQAAFGSFSDLRLKENIVDLSPQLPNIMALRPVEFDYIESEGGGHQISFIAQEFEEVYPDAVAERADGMKTLTGWGKTEARLVKAIQELKAEFDAYKAAHP